jgi:hypothetical protein
MQEHVHTGVVSFLFAGISAIVMFQLVRLGSAWLVTKGGVLESIGTSTGALVNPTA